MRFSRVRIDAFGTELAPVVVSTEELEERLAPLYRELHVQPGQLLALTGIEERRWWEEGTTVTEGAIAAARKCVEASSVAAGEVEAVLYTGVCRELYEPATACAVADAVGVTPDAVVHDLSNACLGVMNGILDLANRIELGQIRNGLVVACETARPINETMIRRMLENRDMAFFTRALTTLTGGSGAAAVMVTDGGDADGARRRLRGGHQCTDPSQHDLCRWGLEGDPAGPQMPFMNTDSAAVLQHGVALGERTWRGFLEAMEWTPDMVDRVICHQVGAGHQEAILPLLGVDPSADFTTFRHLGNMGTVSLPMTAALAEEQGFLEPGQRVAFLGIGSGLNCLMLGLEW